MGEEKKSAFEEHGDELEELAVAAYIDLLSNPTVDAKVRKEAADAVMRARGRAEPLRGSREAPVVTFNFGVGLKSAVAGIDEFQQLLARPAPDAETKEVS